MGYETDQKHAVILVKEKLGSKDRSVSTSGEDMNDNMNDSGLSERQLLLYEQCGSTIQRRRKYHEPCQNQRRRIIVKS